MKLLIIAHDKQMNRNVGAVLAFHDEMINKKQAMQTVEKRLMSDYDLHNLIILPRQ